MDSCLRHRRPTRTVLTVIAALVGALLIGSGVLTTSAPADATGPHRHRVIETTEAPEAIGPYSQGIGAGPTLYLSGQLPIDPDTGEMLTDATIEEQTTQVLRNLRAVLRADHMTMRNVVSTTVYLDDLDDYDRFNAAYAAFFSTDPPARQTVQAARIPRDADIEISAIAVR